MRPNRPSAEKKKILRHTFLPKWKQKKFQPKRMKGGRVIRPFIYHRVTEWQSDRVTEWQSYRVTESHHYHSPCEFGFCVEKSSKILKLDNYGRIGRPPNMSKTAHNMGPKIQELAFFSTNWPPFNLYFSKKKIFSAEGRLGRGRGPKKQWFVKLSQPFDKIQVWNLKLRPNITKQN